MLIKLLFFWILHLFVGAQSTQLNQQARSCSFNDQQTGYSVIWHTNCTGYVNFVLNVRNFPMGGNFWTGIGFGLLPKSVQMVLVEVIDGYVMINQAEVFPNRVPTKNLAGSPLIINPRGTFFGAQLEATFSIHESVLSAYPKYFDIPFKGGNYNGNNGGFSTGLLNSYNPYNTPQMNQMDGIRNNYYIGQNSQYSDPSMPYSNQRQQMYDPFSSQNYNSGYGGNNPFDYQKFYQSNTNDYSSIYEPQQAFFQRQEQPYGEWNRRLQFHVPTLTEIFSQTKKSKRQSGIQSALKRTAYDGQDKRFEQNNPINPFFYGNNDLLYNGQNYNQRLQDFNRNGDSKWRFFDPGNNNTQMYYPYRTTISENYSPNPYRQNKMYDFWNNNNNMPFYNNQQNSYNGFDPSWCEDYVRYITTNWSSTNNAQQPAKNFCGLILESLRNSDHKCCNTLKRIQCI